MGLAPSIPEVLALIQTLNGSCPHLPPHSPIPHPHPTALRALLSPRAASTRLVLFCLPDRPPALLCWQQLHFCFRLQPPQPSAQSPTDGLQSAGIWVKHSVMHLGCDRCMQQCRFLQAVA